MKLEYVILQTKPLKEIRKEKNESNRRRNKPNNKQSTKNPILPKKGEIWEK